MKETEIDCMKYRKSTHLAGVDIEMIVSEKSKCLLTIKEAYYDTNVNVSGNKTAGYFLEFTDNVKPMVVNSGNRKIIAKICEKTKNITAVESRKINNWIGLQIELYFDASVKMMGSVVGGIKVRETYPLPVLQANTPEFDKAKLAIEKSGYTVEQVRSKYQVSKEVEALLNGK